MYVQHRTLQSAVPASTFRENRAVVGRGAGGVLLMW